MKMDYVRADLKSANKWGEAFFYLDQFEVLEDILSLRKRWGLNKRVEYKDLKLWLENPCLNRFMGEAAYDLWSEMWDRLATDKAKDDVDEVEIWRRERELNMLNPVEFELEILLRKYGMEAKYKGLLLRVIVCGIVKDKDLESNDIYNFSDNFVTGDLLERAYFWKMGLEKVYGDTRKRELERDRLRYWRHKEGLTFVDMALEEGKESDIEPEDIVDGIKKSVSRYKKFLKGTNR